MRAKIAVEQHNEAKMNEAVFGFKRYDCSRGLDRLQATPFRELFVNRVSCILVHPK